jgi:hypothetical protein
MARSITKRERSLLHALRRAERAERVVSATELAAETGYAAATLKTYFSKKLEGALVFRHERGWRVKGAVACGEDVFARRMSQKAGAVGEALANEESWRQLTRKLLYEGQRRGYRLSEEEVTLALQLRAVRSRPSGQSALFDGD